MTARHTADPATLMTVTAGGRRIAGFILARGKSGFEATRANGQSLGMFDNANAAADAIADAVQKA
jgi:hypothetical protein